MYTGYIFVNGLRIIFVYFPAPLKDRQGNEPFDKVSSKFCTMLEMPVNIHYKKTINPYFARSA
jgi:hypothetical protein